MKTAVEKIIPEGPNSITFPIAVAFSGKAGGDYDPDGNCCIDRKRLRGTDIYFYRFTRLK